MPGVSICDARLTWINYRQSTAESKSRLLKASRSTYKRGKLQAGEYGWHAPRVQSSWIFRPCASLMVPVKRMLRDSRPIPRASCSSASMKAALCTHTHNHALCNATHQSMICFEHFDTRHVVDRHPWYVMLPSNFTFLAKTTTVTDMMKPNTQPLWV